MILSVEIPDSFAGPLHLDGERPDRRALEVLALEGYRTGELSRGKVGELLGFTFYETEAFLKKNAANIPVSFEEFEAGSDALGKLIDR